MTDAKPQTRARLPKRYVAEAAAHMGLSASDGAARHHGLLRLLREVLGDAMASQLVAGKLVDPSAYLKVVEMLDRVQPVVKPKEHVLQVEVVGRGVDIRKPLEAATKVEPSSDPPPTDKPTSEAHDAVAAPSNHLAGSINAVHLKD